MDFHVINRTDKFWEIFSVEYYNQISTYGIDGCRSTCVYVMKVRQLFIKHAVSKIVSSIGWTAVKKYSVLCCKDIDAWTTSNDM